MGCQVTAGGMTSVKFRAQECVSLHLHSISLLTAPREIWGNVTCLQLEAASNNESMRSSCSTASSFTLLRCVLCFRKEPRESTAEVTGKSSCKQVSKQCPVFWTSH
jgi:hypothetical protein